MDHHNQVHQLYTNMFTFMFHHQIMITQHLVVHQNTHHHKNITKSFSLKHQLHQPQLHLLFQFNHKTNKRLLSTFWLRNQKKHLKFNFHNKFQHNLANQKFTSSDTRHKYVVENLVLRLKVCNFLCFDFLEGRRRLSTKCCTC